MRASLWGRLNYFEVLWRQGLLGKAVAALWLFYGFFAAVRDDFFSPELQEAMRGIHMIEAARSIPFSWWLCGLFVIAWAWTFEAAFRHAKEQSTTISALQLQLEDRAKRQAAIDELWRLRADGIKIRNEDVATDSAYVDWQARWHKWRDEVWQRAGEISPNLKQWLEYLDQTGPPPERTTQYRNPDHMRFVEVGSEMLQRMQQFLELEIK